MQTKHKATVTLTLMDGPEPWVRVTHARGWFKVPADVCISEVLTGALEGWSSAARRRLRHSEPTVRVPLSQYLRAWGAGQL